MAFSDEKTFPVAGWMKTSPEYIAMTGRRTRNIP
jgi:hypothetical protein